MGRSEVVSASVIVSWLKNLMQINYVRKERHHSTTALDPQGSHSHANNDKDSEGKLWGRLLSLKPPSSVLFPSVDPTTEASLQAPSFFEGVLLQAKWRLILHCAKLKRHVGKHCDMPPNRAHPTCYKIQSIMMGFRKMATGSMCGTGEEEKRRQKPEIVFSLQH